MGKFDYITSDTIIDTMGHPIFSQTQWPASKCPFNLLTYPYFSGAAIPANEPACPEKNTQPKCCKTCSMLGLLICFRDKLKLGVS